jgi:hypothetical protein
MELTAKPDAWNKSLADNISFVSHVFDDLFVFNINVFVFRLLIVIPKTVKDYHKCLWMFFDFIQLCLIMIFDW